MNGRITNPAPGGRGGPGGRWSNGIRRAFARAVVLIVAGLPQSGLFAASPAKQEPDVLLASAAVVEVRVGYSSQAWTLAREANPDIFAVTVPRGERREVRFVSGDRTLTRAVAQGEQADFVIRFDGFDYPTRIVGTAPAAVFDAAYQAAHRGRIEVVVPEVYELVNIALAMTPTARANRYLIARQHAYYDEVEKWFAPFDDHPLIAVLDRELAAGHYFDLKMNAYAFEFDADSGIVRSAVYDRTGFAGSWQNSLAPHLEPLQSYAEASRFREFFQDHEALYGAQEGYFRDQIELAAMIGWLGREFPSARASDGYKVVFSPLVGGSQSVTWFESNGYRELQVHVNFPYPSADGDEGLSEKGIAFRRAEIVFTELNHGYINPVAEPFREEIERAFSDRGMWAKPGSSADSYGNAMSLFLEYMNWALVAVYAEETAPPEDRARLIGGLDAWMGDGGRGLIQFAAFKNELLRLYRGRAAGVTAEGLYPQMLAWCEAQRAAAGAAR